MKDGGFIPGIQPGRPTTRLPALCAEPDYLAGLDFLSVIAVLPNLFLRSAPVEPCRTFEGTAVLIMIGVGLDTVKADRESALRATTKGSSSEFVAGNPG